MDAVILLDARGRTYPVLLEPWHAGLGGDRRCGRARTPAGAADLPRRDLNESLYEALGRPVPSIGRCGDD